MLDETSEQEKNIFKIPSALVKRINDVNALIEKAKTDEVYAIEPDGTWESAYIFNPINVGKARATISYVEPYHNDKLYSEMYDLRNQFRYNEFKYGLNWIIRSIKKGYRQEGKADMLKAAQSETNETTTAGSSGAFVGAMGTEPISREPFKLTSENEVPKITMFSDEEGIECKKMDETEVVDEETTASSSGQYSTPKMWAKSKKDMKFGQKPMYPNGKIVENKGKTTYPNGKFVTFDDCVKPGHSDVAENGGCSTGAVDNVVKTSDIYSEVAKKTGKTIEEVKSIIEKNIKKD
jgi:hypothetical protein